MINVAVSDENSGNFLRIIRKWLEIKVFAEFIALKKAAIYDNFLIA